MRIYVVIEVTSMNQFTDSYGDVANDKEEIIGIYDSKEKAKEILEKELINTDDEDDENVCYEIREFELNE